MLKEKGSERAGRPTGDEMKRFKKKDKGRRGYGKKDGRQIWRANPRKNGTENEVGLTEEEVTEDEDSNM
ncbi:hypothetical protein KM043_016315 [Ampulex compressa]|nr:hypothetical protein KM043_016315 [Ampulex compressa]